MIPFKIGYCINYTKSQRDVILVEVIESLTNSSIGAKCWF
jgi:hypothetical protein